MDILHLSAECYPAAKVGGLADVVGSLPKYLNRLDHNASVVMPAYQTSWLQQQDYETVFAGTAPIGMQQFEFTIKKCSNAELGFSLYIVEIPGQFDRPGIYADPETGEGYWHELDRFLSFQMAVLEWVDAMDDRPDILHCHDHHTGLVPFMAAHCYRYKELQKIPTVFTIHNAEYHGEHDFEKGHLLPPFDMEKVGLLDWDGKLNMLAAGIKCAWQITTVSPSYMQELSEQGFGLEWLFQNERQKSTGILNGIDSEVWNPKTDEYLDHHFSVESRKEGKSKNKQQLCRQFNLDPHVPLFGFIGRLVHQKGADLLSGLIRELASSNNKANIILLGTGETKLENEIGQLHEKFSSFFSATLAYDEKLAHRIYAGTDFLLMPSRAEPCGLNQMYAMRYGSVPVVHNVGGLKDTVTDIKEENGYGFTMDELSVFTLLDTVERALKLHNKPEKMDNIVKKIMGLNFSWNASAKQYISMYTKVLKKTL